MDFVNLWCPPGVEGKGLPGGPKDARRWLNKRCRLDRVWVKITNGHNPIAANDKIPFGTIRWARYLNRKVYREREMCLSFCEQPHGSLQEGSAGHGYNSNTETWMTLSEFKAAVLAVKDSLGKAGWKRVKYLQVGNETDYCPDIRSAGKFSAWVNHQIKCLRWLHKRFSKKLIVTGGQHLTEKHASGGRYANWIMAKDGLHRDLERLSYDVHFNFQTLAEAEAAIVGFRDRFSDAPIGCFENVQEGSKKAWVELAKQYDLVAMADFNGIFPFYKWGVNTQKVKTISCEAKNSAGDFIWLGPNAKSTTQASKAAGAFKKATDQP